MAIQKHSRRQLVVASFLTTGLVVVASLATGILLARVLGPDGRGLLLALTFWPALIAAMLNLSLNEATAYHVASRVGTPHESLATSTAFQLVLVALVCSLAITATGLGLVVPAKYDQYLGLIIVYALAFVPVTQLDLYFRAVLQGRGAIVSLNAVRLIQPVSNLALLIALLVLGILDVRGAMAVTIGAMTVSLVLGAALARPSLLKFESGLHREIAGTGWRFHKANLLLYAASEFDKVIVLVLLTTTQVGLFAVAMAVSSIGTGIVLQSLGLMLMRDMASAEGEADLKRVFVANMRAAFAVLLVGNGVAGVLAPWAIPLLYGASFAAAVPVTVLFLGMGALKGARQMIDKALRATHHTRTGMIGEATALGGLAILGSIGAVVGGLEGLALGALVAQAVALLVVLRPAGAQFSAGACDLWPFQRAALDDVRAFLWPKMPSEIP